MDITIRSPLMADRIKELLDGNTIDGATFSFVQKKGLDMTFDVRGENIAKDDAAAIAKKAIKSTEYGKGISFSVI